MLARKPGMLVTVALANKMARIVWAFLAKGEVTDAGGGRGVSRGRRQSLSGTRGWSKEGMTQGSARRGSKNQGTTERYPSEQS